VDTASKRAARSAALLSAGALAAGPRTPPLAQQNRGGRRQGGQALLILVVMLAAATVLLVYGSTTEAGRIVQSEARTRSVLEHARQALIGRAVADANRPGSLPCPDGDDDGSADLFVGSACASYIGRLPWRTLGVGDLRDQTGERLWYALSPPFRDHPSAPALNSDTKGSLTVFGASEETVVTAQAIAVIFAPGVALPGQRRDDSVELCASTGKTVERRRCAKNYLDTNASVNNAAAAGPYIGGRATLSYNDKLAIIVASDLMPLVERRVALEIRNALISYRTSAACGCYPWPDSSGDGVSDVGVNRGRLPARTALPENWKAGVLPAYVLRNDWPRVLHYGVARRALESSGERCSSCAAPDLSVDSLAGHDVVLVTAGYAGAKRPSSNPADYFEDTENRNDDDRYVTPASANADRDRLFSIVAFENTCAAHARVLTDNLPCAGPSKSPREVCRNASSALARCACSTAATALLQPPCLDRLDAASCDSAVNQLRRCML
jgi:hypothetical protein